MLHTGKISDNPGAVIREKQNSVKSQDIRKLIIPHAWMDIASIQFQNHISFLVHSTRHGSSQRSVINKLESVDIRVKR